MTSRRACIIVGASDVKLEKQLILTHQWLPGRPSRSVTSATHFLIAIWQHISSVRRVPNGQGACHRFMDQGDFCALFPKSAIPRVHTLWAT
jgi:hypothetical protein